MRGRFGMLQSTATVVIVFFFVVLFAPGDFWFAQQLRYRACQVSRRQTKVYRDGAFATLSRLWSVDKDKVAVNYPFQYSKRGFYQ